MTALKSSLYIRGFLLLLQILTVKTDWQPPCPYKDTVPLKNYTLSEGSYLSDGIIVPKNETWCYNYRMLVRDVMLDEPPHPHVRACVCKFRPCIYICCQDDGDEYVAQSNECTPTGYSETPDMNVTTEQGKTFVANIRTQFIIQYGRPGRNLFCLRNNYNFTLYENGSIYAYNDHGTRIFSKNDYCLSPVMTTTNGTTFQYYPWVYEENKENNAKEITRNGIVMITSVPFMLITILAYLLSGRVSLTIKSTCCYLFALSLAYTTLSLIILLRNIEPTYCSILGYTTYFAFLASYSWLAVISYELYWNIVSISNSATQCETLMFYSLFGWGLPTFLLGFALFAQHQNWDSFYKPNIGGDYCFFEKKRYNIMIYFYGPSIVLVSFNVLMFILTIRRITGGTTLNNAFKSKRGLRNKLKVYLKKCGLYARLFFITGIAWVFEIFDYCFPDNPIFNTLFYLVAFQGYFIFLLVVFTKEMRVAFRDRFNSLFGRKKCQTSTKQKTSDTQETAF